MRGGKGVSCRFFVYELFNKYKKQYIGGSYVSNVKEEQY